MAFNFSNITGQIADATENLVDKGLNKAIPGDGIGSKIARGFLGSQANRLINSSLFPGGANSQAPQDIANVSFANSKDIRAKLSLSPGVGPHFYKDPSNSLLAPLSQTDGVVWPYTPNINVSYSAAYTANALTHANYQTQSYGMSSVDQITCTGTFTANTETEALYVLATLNFLRSATKSFFGTDTNRGTPPPVLRFSAHGPYMFNSVPVVLTTVNQDFEQGVDYIDARAGGSGSSIGNVTRVPTSMLVTVTLVPAISRKRQTEFSLKKYSRGEMIGSRTGRGTLP